MLGGLGALGGSILVPGFLGVLGVLAACYLSAPKTFLTMSLDVAFYWPVPLSLFASAKKLSAW
jgi:hypothetical protein